MANQLVMVWERKAPPQDVPMPAGFTVRPYVPTDKSRWVALWKLGNIGVDLTEDEAFDAMATKIGVLGFQPERDTVMICDAAGDTVATISSFIHTNEADKGRGHIHMVSSDPSVRGRGIGNAMMSIAMKRLYDAGCKDAILRTDDFRLPAIKSYLKLGFRPELSGEGMKERWNAVYKELGLPPLE